MVEEICGRMKKIIPKFTKKFTSALTFTSESELQGAAIKKLVQKVVDDLTKQIHEYTSELLYNWLLMEIEMYRLIHHQTANKNKKIIDKFRIVWEEMKDFIEGCIAKFGVELMKK